MHPKPSETYTDKIEETLISFILGMMTIITFANVVARYLFNSNILWALEMTVFLFGWLVLLGVSYAVKKRSHLGVDAVINMLPQRIRRLFGLVSVLVCIAYTSLLLKGAWDYWANFANLPRTEGRWFPLGFEETFLAKGWYEVNDIPLPTFLVWMEGVFNEGDPYNKLPRLIPYAILPLSMALLLYRFAEAAKKLWAGDIDRIIASHEVEAEIEEMHERRMGKN